MIRMKLIGLLLVLLMIPGLNIYPGSPQAGKSLPDRAFALQQAAVESQKQGELIRAEEQFKQAIDLYHRALKSFEISWNPEFNRNRLFCIESLKKLAEKRKPRKRKHILDEILYKVGTYCKKLEAESLYFYCKEFVNEMNDYSIQGNQSQRGNRRVFRRRSSDIKRAQYIYSYQIIQKKGKKKETRKLVRGSDRGRGRTTGAQRARINRASVVFERMIFGPIGILGFDWQSMYDYRIVREDNLFDQPVYVVDCIPKNPLNSDSNNVLFGQAWIRKSDYSVLRIDWEPKSVVLANKKYGFSKFSFPRLRFQLYTEYKLKRSGIRYPTHGFFKEYYIGNKDRENVLRTVSIDYKNYRFFKVETDTELSPPEI